MFTLNCKGRLLQVEKPLVMGIINVTPDSFYDGGKLRGTDEILKKAEQMLKEGATIIDIGGQSTRPGSERITQEDELKRVIDPVSTVYKNFPEAFISVDTFYSSVASEAVAAGACIINDISAGSIDNKMITKVAELHVPYVLMHMKGKPQTMQQQAQYKDVTKEVLDFFIVKREELYKAGVRDIIIDPGFGFGKTIEHNFTLLRNLSVFEKLNAPILLGVSRKSSIYKTLGITAGEALNGTTILNTIGLVNGASILRVHDVKEASEAVKLFVAYMGQ
ncbi:MAG TPA: dihydropteroate synthase [Chitinophagaceae bacterium]|nr:dihydropteroate synthase [Chitinophagaceae bacterium]